MKRINLDNYLQTKYYFQIFDVLLKNIDVTKDVFLVENEISPSSYRLARKVEQNIGKEIITKLSDIYNYNIPSESEIKEVGEKLNQIYFDIYYKIYNDYDEHVKYIDDLISKNSLLFPIIYLFKLFLNINSNKDLKHILDESLSLFETVKKYISFFNDDLMEVYEILNVVLSNINVNDYMMIDDNNGLLYFVISSKALSNKNYIQALHFSQKCKKILLEDGNYKRLIYLNFNLLTCNIYFKNYIDSYELSRSQLLMLQSFGINSIEKSMTLKHYILSALALKKYDEVIEIIENENELNITEFCEYLIALYNTNNKRYLEYLKRNIENNDLDDKQRKICEIINEYLLNSNKKILNELNGIVMTILIEVLKEN